MQSNMNPELQLMLTRPLRELNQKAVQAELKAMYCRKAWRCGLTLDGYCARFSVRKSWEVRSDDHTSESSS